MQPSKNMEYQVYQFKAMGSPCAFCVYHLSYNVIQNALQLAQEEVHRLEKKYSRFLNHSVLSNINEQAGVAPVKVDGETAGLINYAAQCFELSDGLFDITSGVFRQIWDFKSPKLPSSVAIKNTLRNVGFNKLNWDGQTLYIPKNMEIDLGGVVKEYAADCARQVLLNNGIQHGLVDLGGDMAVVGEKPDQSPWVIGIRDPSNPAKAIVSIPLMQGAIATSGHYERFMMINGKRYCHIINPKTGWPAEYCATVSVTSPQCLVSGSLATIAMLKEEKAQNWLKEQEAVFFVQNSQGQCFGSLA